MVLFLGLIWASSSWALSGPDNLVRGIGQYYQAKFPVARASLNAALASSDMTPNLRAQTHFFLGQISLAEGNKPEALKHFSQAKNASSSFKPDSPPPQVLKLWKQAPAGVKPATAQAQPKTKAKPAAQPRGYIVQVENNGNIMLDLGDKHGVKDGDYFTVIKKVKIKHPVTGGSILRKVKLAIVQVTEVFSDSSDSKLIKGNRTQLTAGLRIEKMKPKARSPKPKASPKQKPITNRIAVMPPALKDPDTSHGPSGWPNDYTSQKASKAILGVSRLPGTPFAVTKKQSANLRKRLPGFNPSDFLKESGSTRSVFNAVAHGDPDAVLNPPLESEEEKLLGKVMDKLHANYIMIWGFYFLETDGMGKLLVCLYKRGDKKPVFVASAQVDYQDVMITLPSELRDVVSFHLNPLFGQ